MHFIVINLEKESILSYFIKNTSAFYRSLNNIVWKRNWRGRLDWIWSSIVYLGSKWGSNNSLRTITPKDLHCTLNRSFTIQTQWISGINGRRPKGIENRRANRKSKPILIQNSALKMLILSSGGLQILQIRPNIHSLNGYVIIIALKKC